MTGDRDAAGDPVRTLFLGSGGFALPILEVLVESPEVRLVAIVSAPDRRSGRRGDLATVPVARRTRELGLPLLQPARLRAPDAIAEIAALQPEFGVLADYGQIVPPSVLAFPAHGILNVHPSALPRYRGATPVPAMILVGEPVAGVTLIRMDEGLDTGPIVAQETWILDGTETSVVLEAEAARRGAGLLRRSLGPWLAGALPATPQPEVGATRTRLLRREDGRLDPALTAAQLERQVRAYLPWPGSFVETAFGRLIVHEARAVAGASGDAPGTLVADGDGLALTTGAGRLHLIRAQLAGHRATGAAELRRGSPALVGQTVLLR